MNRDYRAIADSVQASPDRLTAMQRVVDALWNGLSAAGVSWVGFYLRHESADEMILGPRRDKPACSPIGLHGACGQCLFSGAPLVVRDVRELGAGYIACDPRDMSEVVMPMLAADGTCWGVLDLDSFDVGAFDETDVEGLALVLRNAGLKTYGMQSKR